MYRQLQRRLVQHVRDFLRDKYQVELSNIVVEQPPKIEMGEYALPLSFELAKRLRKAPRKIAEEFIATIPPIDGFLPFEVAGAGYINARVDRAALASQVVRDAEQQLTAQEAAVVRDEKILVEHTSINPNKAAHIGHLRNSILGDTFVRLLRAAGRQVDVQNYIDNTGVQVADVVVGFVYIDHKSKAEIEQLIESTPKFDYYCWDLYAKVSQWYAEDKANLQVRLDTLHAIEQGGNELSEIAELISTAVLHRHLETMERLQIEYDFLPRESEILRLHFWNTAFEQLKAKGVLRRVTTGKNKGCWVMTRPGAVGWSAGIIETEMPKAADSGEGTDDLQNPDDDAKVIVRSNGTVGYVGKDIAYHLWKFGLLGVDVSGPHRIQARGIVDFGYKKFFQYTDGHWAWISTDPTGGEPDHPHFGGVSEIYNVIDARQSEPQETVKEAIRLLGYGDKADHYTHFSYEMVALTPRCAMELGYTVSEEDQQRSYIEVSGRKGFGVKADDLLDKLIVAAKAEVDSRHPDLTDDERLDIATQIAIGALRYFMLKFTKQSVIAFDFREALSFEGETGPYAQYAIVRAANIFRKGGTTAEEVLAKAGGAPIAGGVQAGGAGLQPCIQADTTQGASTPGVSFAPYFEGETGTEIWQLWVLASQTSHIIEQAIAATEPAYLAKHAFQLAQQFSNFYHRHHILTESDEGRKQFLMTTAAVVQRELIRVLAIMGVSAPTVM
ncbi:MAG TPA: arginine--tRNA ligase [Clostridia bacterium]|nr:arginine--tRNA ligase [Clostridia bacterium]